MGYYIAEGGTTERVKSRNSMVDSWCSMSSVGRINGRSVATDYINASPINKTIITVMKRKINSITGRIEMASSSSVQAWSVFQCEATLIQPITSSGVI